MKDLSRDYTPPKRLVILVWLCIIILLIALIMRWWIVAATAGFILYNIAIIGNFFFVGLRLGIQHTDRLHQQLHKEKDGMIRDLCWRIHRQRTSDSDNPPSWRDDPDWWKHE